MRTWVNSDECICVCTSVCVYAVFKNKCIASLLTGRNVQVFRRMSAPHIIILHDIKTVALVTVDAKKLGAIIPFCIVLLFFANQWFLLIAKVNYNPLEESQQEKEE